MANNFTGDNIIPNILIVDDNPNNIFALKSILEEMPVKLYEARSGNEALEILLQHEFALVLMDVQMPEIDGFETAELMQKNKHTKDVSIIFVTAISKEEQYVKKGLQIGAVDYLFKPVDPVILKSKVSVFIQYYIQRKQMENMVTNLSSSQQMLSEKNKSLNQLARTDTLTGLENRLNFQETLERMINNSKESENKFALLFLDLDNFKNVNDTLGHDSGDQLLKEVAERLKKAIRRTDLISKDSISRLGGDEFAIILPEIEESHMAGEIADRIIHSLSEPFILQNTSVSIGVSIGIVFYPLGGDTVELLTKNADVAMYRAKQAGKNNYQYFSESADQLLKMQSQLASEIREALNKNQFHLVYQPIVNLHTQELVAVEAICQWNNERLGEISADEFMPVAEETKIIQPLGIWILNNVVEDMLHCYSEFNIPLHCHINLTPKQLFDHSYLQYIENLSKTDDLRGGLTFELTETVLIQDIASLEAPVNSLIQLGFKICIDHCGNEDSVQKCLSDLPISSLKISKTLIQTLIKRPDSMTILKSILDLTKNLNYLSFADGIQTEDQLNILLKLNCLYGQGDYFSKPLPLDELKVYLKKCYVPSQP